MIGIFLYSTKLTSMTIFFLLYILSGSFIQQLIRRKLCCGFFWNYFSGMWTSFSTWRHKMRIVSIWLKKRVKLLQLNLKDHIFMMVLYLGFFQTVPPIYLQSTSFRKSSNSKGKFLICKELWSKYCRWPSIQKTKNVP